MRQKIPPPLLRLVQFSVLNKEVGKKYLYPLLTLVLKSLYPLLTLHPNKHPPYSLLANKWGRGLAFVLFSDTLKNVFLQLTGCKCTYIIYV